MEHDDWESDLHEATAHLGDSHQVGGKTQYIANPVECLKCLKDLQIHLKDTSDLGQRVRLKLGEWKVLSTHLVPLFVAYREDNDIAPNVLKVLVKMTARIDIMSSSDELRHLQHLQDYKEAFLQKDTFIILMGLLVDNMDDDEEGNRPEARQMIFDMVLDLLRNLVTVPDPAPGDAGFSPLRRDMQMAYIRHFHDEGVLDFFGLFAEGLASEQDCDKKAWAVTDIIYNICTHSDPEALAYGSKGKDKNRLRDLLAREQADTRLRMPMASRHSRFGTSLISKNAEGGASFLTSVMETNTVSKSGHLWRREFHDPEARNEKKVNMFHDPFFVDLEEGSVRDHNQLNPHVKNALEASKIMGEAVMEGLRKFFADFLATSFSSLVPILRGTLGHRREGVPDESPGGPFARMKLLNLVSWFLEFQRHQHNAAVNAAKQKGEEPPFIDIAAVQGAIDLDMIQFTAARLREYGKGSNMHASHLVVTLRALAQQVKTIDVVVDCKDVDTRDCGQILTQNMIKDNNLFQLSWILKNYKSSSHDPRILTYAVEVFHYMLRLMRTLTERAGKKLEFQVETMGRTVKRSVTTMEQEIARLADARVVDNLFHLLEKYKRLSAQLNSMLVKLIYSVIRAQKENIVVFFELSYFCRIQRIYTDPLVRDKRQGKKYGEMVSLLQYILRQFFKCAEENSCVFVELMFRKVPESQKEALLGDHTAEFAAILDNYENEDYRRVLERMRDGETLRDLKTRQRRLADGTLPWSEEEDEILRTRFHCYAEHPLCAELLAAELPEDTQRIGAQVRKRLVELGLISSGRQVGMPARKPAQRADPSAEDPGEPPAKKAKKAGDGEVPDTLLETDLERLIDAAIDAEDGGDANAGAQAGAAQAPAAGKAMEDPPWFDGDLNEPEPAGESGAAEGDAMDWDLEAELENQMDHDLFDTQSQSQQPRPPAASPPAPAPQPPGDAAAPGGASGCEVSADNAAGTTAAPEQAGAGAAATQGATAAAPPSSTAAQASGASPAASPQATPSGPTQGNFDLERALESQMDKDSQVAKASQVDEESFDLEGALASQMEKDASSMLATPRRPPASAHSQETPMAERVDLERMLFSEMRRDSFFLQSPGVPAASQAAAAAPPSTAASGDAFDLTGALASQMDRDEAAAAAARPSTAASGPEAFDLTGALASQMERDQAMLGEEAPQEDQQVALESMLDEDLDLP